MAQTDRRSAAWRFREGERRALLVFGDLVASSLAALLSLALWAQLDWLGFTWDFVLNRAGWVSLLPLAWLALMVNSYDLRRAASFRQSLRGVLLAAASGLVLYMFVYFIPDEPTSLPRRGPLYFLALTSLFTLVWRWLYVRVFTAPAFLRRVLVVGAGDSGLSLLEVTNQHKPGPFHLVGLLDDDVAKHQVEFAGAKVLG
ncbi:MAG: nucleoside-diphosphate sugar epimerase/dehydratase, partial [Anaerolineales bacterium]